MRLRLRTAFIVLLLAVIGSGPASAHELVIMGLEYGYVYGIEISLDDGSRIEAGAQNVVGPAISLQDEPPYLTADPNGRGGSWLTLEKDGDVTCSLSENTPGWSLTVDEFASSATLTSTVPGCAGTIQLTSHGLAGFSVSTAPITTPAPGGSIAITINRAATITGSFAGPITERYSATISYTRVYEPGGGVPIFPWP